MIRSRRLAVLSQLHQPVSGTKALLYAPPAGYTAIVKQVSFLNAHTAVRSFDLEIGTAAGASPQKVASVTDVPSFRAVDLPGRYLVLYGDMGLVVNTVGWVAGQAFAGCQVYGVLLEGTPP